MEITVQMAILLSHSIAFVLLVLTCGPPLTSTSASSSAGLRHPGDAHLSSHGNIFTPLLKALSDQGVSWRDAGPKGRMKPDSRYVKYMTELYKVSSGKERSLDNLYNTVRLITPRDECVGQSKEVSMQDLSYNLNRVKDKEQLLKSVLLYSLDKARASPVASVCYLNIKEQEPPDACQLCPGTHQTINFTLHADRPRRQGWVEVDVTSFLHPLVTPQRKNIHLLLNLTCAEDRAAVGPLGSPSLLLYLSDNSKLAHQRWPVAAKKTHKRLKAAMDAVGNHVDLTLKQRMGHRRRRRRESAKGKRSKRSVDSRFPDLLPVSQFPTSDCALYDFRVRFSQLKLDHWIVFPPKYNPRYCRGICPRTLGSIYGSPVHTMVQNIIYEKLDSSIPRPSCVPSHYDPLSVMIYEDDGTYAYKEFEDMIATRCTCR